MLFTKDGIASGSTDYLKGLDESYIVSWTNTQITVKVPSFVRKGYVIGNVEDDDFGSGAGSGKIKVKTVRNDSVISSGNLTIEYLDASREYQWGKCGKNYLIKKN